MRFTPGASFEKPSGAASSTAAGRSSDRLLTEDVRALELSKCFLVSPLSHQNVREHELFLEGLPVGCIHVGSAAERPRIDEEPSAFTPAASSPV
jgi:hypothetical protein